MGRRNRLIESLKTIAASNRQINQQAAAEEFTPAMYAAMAIALHRVYGFGEKRINRVFLESQHIWCEEFPDQKSMLDECERLVHIKLMNKEQALEELWNERKPV